MGDKGVIRTSVGILAWTKLIEGRMKSIKKSRDKRREDLG